MGSAATDDLAGRVAANYERINNRIADAGADPARIKVLAVTKAFGPEAVAAAHLAGIAQVGESYAQEMIAKWSQLDPELGTELEAHFIGHLQSNKVRQLLAHVSVWQSLDRSSVIDEVAKRCSGARVMLQLNISGAKTQGGAELSQADDLYVRAKDGGLEVVGAMAIGPQSSPSEVLAAFLKLRDFADKHQLEQRSMGMSADLEQAVRAGSTMIRVGTALFGERRGR